MTIEEIVEREVEGKFPCSYACDEEHRCNRNEARAACLAVAKAVVEDFVAGEPYAVATYLGGYSERREIEIFHHGMATVFNMLRALVKTDG